MKIWGMSPKRRRWLLINSGKRCWLISEMLRFRCWPWMKSSCRGPLSWRLSRISNSPVNSNTNPNTWNNWSTKTKRWKPKWNFSKVNCNSMQMSSMNWQKGLIFVTKLSRSIRLRLGCLKRRLRRGKGVNSKEEECREQRRRALAGGAGRRRSQNKGILVSLIWLIFFKREFLTTKEDKMKPKTSWMK